MKFELSESQVEKIREWCDDHAKKHVVTYTGAIGGRYSYTFTPTSIGDIVTVSCFCGDKADVSEV